MWTTQPARTTPARHWQRPLAVALVAALVALVGLAAPTEATSRAGAHTAHATAADHTASHGLGRAVLHGTTADGRHFRGTFDATSFQVVNGALMATGQVSGWLRGHGKPQRVAPQTVTTQVLQANGTDLTGASAAAQRASTSGAAFVPAAARCPILNLVLGPLDLDLLGLQVHLDRVVLNIVAQSGAGNLLGNLLCAVAGLLDSGTPLDQLLTQLSGLLQQILGALGGLGTAV